jgi:hypothetical protein
MDKIEATNFLRGVLSKSEVKRLQAALKIGKEAGFHYGGA